MRNKKSRKRHPYLWAVLYSILLTGYAIFTLLDAFVLPRDMVYLEDIVNTPSANKTISNHENSRQDNVISDINDSVDGMEEAEKLTQSEELAQSGELAEPKVLSESVVTDTSYESAGISITIKTQRKYDTEIYIADVTIKDASYLRAGLAGGAFGRNVSEPTSKMAEQNDAILAINGDYYGFRDSGFVMRNGYFYRDTARTAAEDDALVVYKDGHMEIMSENDADVQELTEDAVQIFSFGPGLIREGDILVNEYSEVEQAMRSNPRTAIGEISPLHYIFLVSDGRTEESEGLSLWELAQIMQELGCSTAYNLDGGGSSTMWFMGRIVNHPTSGRRSGERRVSDIVYIGE